MKSRTASSSDTPGAVTLQQGDAWSPPLRRDSLDLVLQNTAYSAARRSLSAAPLTGAIWRWLRFGGAVVWYDFTVDDLRNRDVRRVLMRRPRALFPEGCIDACRVTLTQAIARAVVRLHPDCGTC